MSDDIVTRLRGAAAGFRIAVGTNDSFTFPTLHSEAADEIEHLREWKDLAYEMRNKYWWVMRRKTLEKFDFLHKTDWKIHNPLGNKR